MRKKVLGGNMDLYMCCQGYYDGLCCGHPKAGSYGDTGNPACMACEMCCCPGWATSATRQYVMDQYDLASDPCDRQIIRFNNFMQLLSCICYTLAIIEPSCPVWKSKFYGAFVLNHRVVLHAIDATPARWRGDAGSSLLDRARTAASSPRNDLVKNSRVHPTHWLISTQVVH